VTGWSDHAACNLIVNEPPRLCFVFWTQKENEAGG